MIGRERNAMNAVNGTRLPAGQRLVGGDLGVDDEIARTLLEAVSVLAPTAFMTHNADVPPAAVLREAEPASAAAPGPVAAAPLPSFQDPFPEAGLWLDGGLAGDAADTPKAPLVLAASVSPDWEVVPNYVPPGSPGSPVGTQWHLSALGNLQKIWDEFTGNGMHVGIYDSGVQYSHHDLNGNYDATRHVVIGAVTVDGANVGNSVTARHGTSVAGLIAAEDDGVGTVGIAFNAKITSVNIFAGLVGDFSTNFYSAAAQAAQFDVMNNSWG
jgi:hypothetical protein